MNKDEFVRLLAKKTGLTLGDTRIVLSEIIDIFASCVENRDELHIRGLGHLVYPVMKLHRRGNMKAGEVEEIEGEKPFAKFYLSRNLKDLMIEDPTKRKIYLTRQAEINRAGINGENDNEDYDEFENEEEK